MSRLLLVGLGGFFGSIARYLLGGLVQALGGSGFPLGTMVVNVVGSFAVGVIITYAIERGALSMEMRMLLAVGVCGGFTTMSTFSYETLALAERDLLGWALLNVAGTMLACLGAVWAGVLIARAL